MFNLFPNSDAPLAGWAIENGGPLLLIGAAALLFGWLVFRRGGDGTPFSGFSSDTDSDSGDGCGGDGGGGD
jgi:hypothetical protein